MWIALFAFHICMAGCEFFRCQVAQRAVWAHLVVQLGYKTPIKPAFEKCVIAGIHGMDNQYAFEPKRDEAGV
jgi:hypothetical protein